MSDIKGGTIIRRLELQGARIQNEVVLVDLEAGKYYATGEVGADVWDYLDAPRSFDEICAHLLDLYDVDRPTCEQQVRSFLDSLFKARLIELGANF